MDYLKNTIFYLAFLRRTKIQMEIRLKQLPDGRLVRKRARGKTYFYAEKDGRLRSLLLRRWEQDVYSEKEHIQRMLERIGQNIPLLENMIERYQPVSQWDDLWNQLGNDENAYKKEYKRHYYRGIYYRSKSEMAIAMVLTSYGIEFKYESTLTVGGRRIHPDFAVKRQGDGQVIFWEHFGRTDLDDYRSDMYERIENYRKSGFDIWDRVIMSFDGEDGSINGDTIDRLIRAFILQ